MRVKQRQYAREATELLEELHFLYEASVRLMLGLGRVDELEGDDFPILIRDPPGLFLRPGFRGSGAWLERDGRTGGQ